MVTESGDNETNVYVSIDESDPEFGDYEITIYEGYPARPENLLSTSNVISELRDNLYTIGIEAVGSGCLYEFVYSVSHAITTAIPEALVHPNTSCDLPNGSLEITNITLNGEIIPADDPNYEFKFTLFEGTSTNPSQQLETGTNTFEGLAEGFYTVEAMNVITGCIDDKMFTINADYPTLEIPMEIEKITTCGGTGSFSASAKTNGQALSYTYDWYNGEVIKASPDFSGALFEVSTTGAYTVNVTDIESGCTTLRTVMMEEETLTSQVNTDASICAGETYSLGSQILSQTGQYSETFVSITNCDSSVVLNLFVTGITASIAHEGSRLLTPEQEAAYQWYRCETPFAIEGAINASFTPTEPGRYQVEVSKNGCIELSECIEFTENVLGLVKTRVKASPFPTSNELTIDFGGQQFSGTIRILDISGQEINRLDVLKVASTHLPIDAPSGTYILMISNESGKSQVIRVLKK